MTAKEKRYVRKLEIKVEQLERHFRIAQTSGMDNFRALYDSRLAMRQAYESLMDAARTLEDCMQEDPAFMELQASIQKGDY